MVPKNNSLEDIVERKLKALEVASETINKEQFIKKLKEDKSKFNLFFRKAGIEEAFVKEIQSKVKKEKEVFTAFHLEDLITQTVLTKHLEQLMEQQNPLSCITVNAYSLDNNVLLHLQIFVDEENRSVYLYGKSNQIVPMENKIIRERVSQLNENEVAASPFLFQQYFKIPFQQAIELLSHFVIWIIQDIYDFGKEEEIQLTLHSVERG